jgi:hypothetical protein
MTKLETAEKKMQELLEEMNGIDVALSKLTPADPARAELKAKKNELLPRYRGAKAHVKDLRRLVSIAGTESPKPATEGADNRLLEEAYKILAHLSDLYLEDQLALERCDVDRITQWLGDYDEANP